ncbi:MAG: putative phospholipid-binding lipoprotein MlaA [Steroidobacteraceae bacterium]|nr:putative phospholipid-binding lipoprotein MlaA [Steroidobacteraceae bacterium]
MPLRLLAALAALFLTACTTQALRPDPRDPLEKWNRSMYTFNDGLDRAIARPAARTYRRVAPGFVQTGISNFWSNATYPATIVNQFLQGKPRAGMSDLGRFLLNTFAGVGGLLDPASAAGIDRNDEDFGQTLAKWGVHPGPYLMLPLLGPSTLRDGFGKVPDRFADPVHYVEDWRWQWGLDGLRLLDRRARALPLTDKLRDIYDPYTFIRSAYFQQREYEIHDGNIEQPPADEDFAPDDADDSGAPAP